MSYEVLLLSLIVVLLVELSFVMHVSIVLLSGKSMISIYLFLGVKDVKHHVLTFCIREFGRNYFLYRIYMCSCVCLVLYV